MQVVVVEADGNCFFEAVALWAKANPAYLEFWAKSNPAYHDLHAPGILTHQKIRQLAADWLEINPDYITVCYARSGCLVNNNTNKACGFPIKTFVEKRTVIWPAFVKSVRRNEEYATSPVLHAVSAIFKCAVFAVVGYGDARHNLMINETPKVCD